MGAARKMLIVYDFDQTITDTHVFYQINGKGKDVLDKVPDADLVGFFGGPERVAKLKAHFSSLRERGCLLRICSFGFVEVIKSCLDRAGLGEFFAKEDIFGADHEKMKEVHCRKYMLIEHLMKREGIAKKEDCYFIDDDHRNILLAQEHGICQTIHVQKGQD